MLLGVKKEGDEEKTSTQSYHFSKEKWTPKAVKKWLKEHNEKPIELEMAKKEQDSEVKEDASGFTNGSDLTLGNDNTTSSKEMKLDGNIVTRKGDVIPEQVPIDKVPDKLFGNVRQQDLPELLESTIDSEVSISEVEEHPDDETFMESSEPEGVSEDYDEEPMESEDEESGELIEPEEHQMPWDPVAAKSDMMSWATDESGKVSKRSLMKWYLDVDAGSGQDSNSYRYPVGAIVNGGPHYCHKALDHSWDLASGNQTGVANRNIQKKIIFIKNREGMPLTEDQMDFTERHMEAYKENANCPDSEKSGTGPGSCGGSTSKKGSDVKWTDTSFTRDNNVKIDLSRGLKTRPNQLISVDIKSPISVWTKTGEKKPSNAYYGNANIMSDKLEKIRLEPGDQLHQFASGLFAVKKSGEVEEVSSREPIHDADDSELKHWDKSVSKKLFSVSNNPYKTDYNKSKSRRMKRNETFLEDEHSPGGLDIVASDEIKMNSSPAGSKIIYEDDQVIDVPVVPMREGVFTGTDGIPTLKKFEYFGKDAHWLEGQPILKGHTAPTELVTYKHNRIGKLMNVTARPDKKDVVAVARYYKDKLTPEDMTRIKSGTPYDGSIAYTTHTSMTSGDLNGTKYNAIEDGGYHFYHFAELANGIGACSTKDGCGFMLNEHGYEPKVFYNDKRRAEVIQENDSFTIKLNAIRIGSNPTITNVYKHIESEQDAINWSKTYVKSGLIPSNMKDKYNNSNFKTLTGNNNMTKLNETKKGMTKDADGNECMFFEMKNKKCPVKTEEETSEMEEEPTEKMDSRYIDTHGNNMTNTYIEADLDVQKMNEAFEQKLNERDTKIAELTAQVEDLVQKQNAAEQELIEKKAAADFEAFSLKLNAKARTEAQTHYDGFKAAGWAYFDANPGILKAELPKMNARGQPAAEGDNAASLQSARDMLKKSQKDMFGKRSH